MAIDGPRGPLDDPRERRTDRQPDPFPRGTDPSRIDARGDEPAPGRADGRSDAERLADAVPAATDDLATRAAEQDRRRRVEQDRRRRVEQDRRRQAEQDRRRQADQEPPQAAQERDSHDEQERAEEERQRAEEERQRQEEQDRRAEQDAERDRAREEEEEPDRDPAVDPASVAGPAVAAAAAAEAGREPNTLADRPSDIEAAQDPDAYRRWQEPGVVPTREELDQALNGAPDDLDPSAPAPAQVVADAEGQPGRDRDGPKEDYVGRHRAEDGSGPDREEGGRHRFEDDLAPDQQHWAPPAAEARADRDTNGPPAAEQDREPGAERDSQTRQGGAAPARDVANEQQSQRSAESGKTIAAAGLAAGGRTVGAADNLVEAASPTGRPAQSQNWGIGRHHRPGDQALGKAVSAAMSGNARASEAARPPERAPQAAPHSGAHTPGQFHQRLQQQHQQQQQDQNRQRGG